MPVAIFLMVTGFSLVTVNDYLLSSSMLHNGSGYRRISYVTGNLKPIIADSDDLVKCHSTSGFGVKLFYLNDIAFRNLILFSPCGNNCVHIAPPNNTGQSLLYSLESAVPSDMKIHFEPIYAAYFVSVTSIYLDVKSFFPGMAVIW